jgi:transcriptional regulator with GAF, ATPase, and Fis domain
MFQPYNLSNDSDSILKRTQIEALKSISQLLVREISSLEVAHSSLRSEIKDGKQISLAEELQRFEYDLIRCALIRTMGKQIEAAKLLGLKKSTLNEKIKRFRINLLDLTT